MFETSKTPIPLEEMMPDFVTAIRDRFPTETPNEIRLFFRNFSGKLTDNNDASRKYFAIRSMLSATQLEQVLKHMERQSEEWRRFI